MNRFFHECLMRLGNIVIIPNKCCIKSVVLSIFVFIPFMSGCNNNNSLPHNETPATSNRISDNINIGNSPEASNVSMNANDTLDKTGTVELNTSNLDDVIIRFMQASDRPIVSSMHFNKKMLLEDISRLKWTHKPFIQGDPVPMAEWELYVFRGGAYAFTIRVYSGPDATLYIPKMDYYSKSTYWNEKFLKELHNFKEYYPSFVDYGK